MTSGDCQDCRSAGEDPAYLMGGVINIRYGSVDVQAQPEDLQRIVLNYAF
jgi:hypothetical protein